MKTWFPVVSLIRAAAVAGAVVSLVVSVSAADSRPTKPEGRPEGMASAPDVVALIGVLKNSEASVAQKARACQQLSLVGDSRAVEALAALLADPVLSAYARTGLEAMPDPAAGDALRAALIRLEGKARVGVINSLGVRGEAASTAALLALIENPSRGGAGEALIALARIPTAAAREGIRRALETGPSQTRASAAEGCLVRAERELGGGDAAAAMDLYDAVRRADVPKAVRLAGFRGAILARGGSPAGLDLLWGGLTSADLAERRIAAVVARELPGSEVSRALVSRISQASPDLRVLLIRAVAQRGEAVPVAEIEAVAGTATGELKIVALEALGVVGQATSVPVLVRALAGGQPTEEADAAQASLVRMAAKEADAAILGAVSGADAPVRVRLLTVLGHRAAVGATEELLRQAGGPDAAVSRAALEALAAVAKVEDLPRVLPVALGVADGAVRDQAERTIHALCLKQAEPGKRSEPLAKAYAQASGTSARKSLLQVMAMLGDSTAARVVGSAYDEATPEIRETALQLLGHWPDATPAPRLLEIFGKSQDPATRLSALRGLVTLASLWAGDVQGPGRGAPPKASIEWLHEANRRVGGNVEEKRILISGLGDLNCAEGLGMLFPHLEDAAVQADAARAVVRAAKGLRKSDLALARPALERVIAISSDEESKREARKLLE